MTVGVRRSHRTLTIRFVGTELDGRNLQRAMANSGYSLTGILDELAAYGYITTVKKPRGDGFIVQMAIPAAEAST